MQNKAINSNRFHFRFFSVARNPRLKNLIFFSFRLGITFITLWYLYVHIWKSRDFENSFGLLKDAFQNTQGILLFGISLLLIGVNWGLEAWKWKILINKFIPVSYQTAFKAILAGTSISLWVPNRAGEYLGRILFVPEGLRMKGIFATLAGNAAQLIVTLILGGIGVLYFIGNVLGNYYLLIGVAALIIILSCCLVFLYLHIGKIRKYIPNYTWLKEIKKYARVYKFYSRQELNKVLQLSILRYLVFCSQFLLLTYFFGVRIPIVDGLLLLFLIYLIQTIIPTTTLTELGVRGASAVFFFSSFTSHTTGVLAASYTLWFINLAFPGMFGLIFLVMGKSRKQKAITFDSSFTP